MGKWLMQNKYEIILFYIKLLLQRMFYFLKYDISLYSMGNFGNCFGGLWRHHLNIYLP